MAIRLATLAIVPVNRVWRLVNPVSNGEPLCAYASAGNAAIAIDAPVINKLDEARRGRFQHESLVRIASRSGTFIGHLRRLICGPRNTANLGPFHASRPMNSTPVVIPLGNNDCQSPLQFPSSDDLPAEGRLCGLFPKVHAV